MKSSAASFIDQIKAEYAEVVSAEGNALLCLQMVVGEPLVEPRPHAPSAIENKNLRLLVPVPNLLDQDQMLKIGTTIN
jgi:hypothetical protein